MNDWNNIPEDVRKNIRKKVLIDCGHIPVTIKDKSPFSGDFRVPKNILDTLKCGIEMYKDTRNDGKESYISICLTDTARYLSSPDDRKFIKERLEASAIKDVLPNEYIELLSASNVNMDHVYLSLQTSNSNLFTNLIKKVKKYIKKSESVEDVYEKFPAIFLSDNEKFSFMFTNEFLLDHSAINEVMKGDWWKFSYEDMTPHDLVKVPDARVKRLEVIKLYDKNKGILCPATYGGLLQRYSDDFDHVAIYSRADDEFIGEKIIRGVVSKEMLSPTLNKNYIQLIMNPEVAEYEFSYYNSKDFLPKKTFKEILQASEKMMNEHNYHIYT